MAFPAQGGFPPGVPPQISIGGGAAGGAPAGPAGPPPQTEEVVAQALARAMELLKAAGNAESDHIYAAKIQKCVSDIQQLLATFQQGHEQALGTTAAHKAMSRAY